MKKKPSSSSASVMVKLGDNNWAPHSDDQLVKARKQAEAKKIPIQVRPFTEAEKAAKPRSTPGV